MKKQENELENHEEMHNVTYLSGMYQNWFLDYASYVILERAVPYVFDGLKPVQRRILHAMKRLDDGRYNKAANIIGYTMQYHPHGDASIYEALVALGQKDLLIDTQGNWGNTHTGDNAAAARYIEARLSKFAGEVVFNPKTTIWKSSYDGRNQEPVYLPIKFPLLLAQGVEGIAVGLACKILPHNFIELIEAAIKHLKNETFELYPDFLTGGMVDVSRYNDGLRGGKIRVRAKINKQDAKTLVITEVPFGTTTGSVIDSIISANDKGKIKIKKIDDNTAQNVEILVHLPPGTSPDKTIDALYAFTDCEVSISPNACIIEDNKPKFLGVCEMLRHSVNNTRELLKAELKIKLAELEDDWHLSSLEKIFFEERIYRILEKDTASWEDTLIAVERGFDPYRSLLKKEIVKDDIVKLTEKPVRKISKFDIKKADEHIKGVEKEIKEVKHHLATLTEYTIAYFNRIREKFSAGKERKTEIRSFEDIEAAVVAEANQKLYVNREEGFFGTGLKKDEYVGDCSDIDDVITFKSNGTYIINKVADKAFAGKDIIHIAVFKKNDTRTIYNVVYQDGKNGMAMVKRFAVSGITRDKEYDITKGTPGSKILYFSANPNGEAEIVKVTLKPRPRLKVLSYEFDFSTMDIKNRSAMGNIFSRQPVHKIIMKEKGVSTLSGQKVWFDVTIQRLNADGRGEFLGEFEGDDKIIELSKSGSFTVYDFDLITRFSDDLLWVEKYDSQRIYTAVFWDEESKFYYLKRFNVDEVASNRKYGFIGEHKDNKLLFVLKDKFARVEVHFVQGKQPKIPEIIDANSFITVKSFKAHGKRVSNVSVETVVPLEPIIKEDDAKVVPPMFDEQIEPEFIVIKNGKQQFLDI